MSFSSTSLPSFAVEATPQVFFMETVRWSLLHLSAMKAAMYDDDDDDDDDFDLIFDF